MIRRLSRARPPLTVDQYVHRATLGLPRAQRLDAATELRAHLLERVTEYEAQGYAREEAEYLAVRGMGEVLVTNRELLGHFFTHRAGWLTLLALLVIGSAWAAYRASQWEGVRPATAIAEDDTAVLQLMAGIWPIFPGFTKAAEVRFPTGTQNVFAALLTDGAKNLRSVRKRPILPSAYATNLSGKGWEWSEADKVKFWQSRFRLLSAAAPDFNFNGTRCKQGEFLIGNLLYASNTYRPKVEGVTFEDRRGIAFNANLESGLCFPNDSNTMHVHPSSLPLNTWSLVSQLPAGPPGQGTLALLLYPSSGSITQDPPAPEHAYRYDAAQGQWLRR